MRKAFLWYLLSDIRRIDQTRGVRGGAGGYSTGAEMALEMFQAGERATAIFTGKGLAVSGTLLLDFCGLFVLHGIFWMGGCGDRVGVFCGIWGEEEGKEFEAL
jgi:hypothetical protein